MAAVADASGLDEVRTDSQDDRVGDRGHELHEWEVRGHEALGRHPRVEVRATEPVELRHRGALVHEGLRLADAGEALLKVGVDDRDPLTRHAVQACRLLPEYHRR